LGELALQLCFLGPKLCTSFADVVDGRLADVVGDLQSADKPLGLGVRLLTNLFVN